MHQAIRPIYSLLIAVIALLVAVVAWLNSKEAKELALSEITIEEGSAWTQPVYDEATNRFYYLAIYEVHISNLSGPTVVLKHLQPAGDDLGFVIALKGQEVQPTDLQAQAFYLNRTLQEIQSNPKLLKGLSTDTLTDQRRVDLEIKPGESKSVRFGIYLYPYDAQGQPLADMALVSFRFIFNNGKTQMFRRGFPILPIMPKP